MPCSIRRLFRRCFPDLPRRIFFRRRSLLSCNSRILTGDTVESVKKHLEEIVPDEVEVRVLKGSDASPTSLYDGAMKDLLVEIGGKIYGDVIPCPEMMLGGTDARFVHDLSDRVYRFSTIYAREDHHVHAAKRVHRSRRAATASDFTWNC